MYTENTFSITDGTRLINDKYTFSQAEIHKIQCKSYRENTGSSKQSGPMTYNAPFDNKTGSQSNYGVRIVLKNKKPFVFGKYISLTKFQKIKIFLNIELEKKAT